MLIKYECDYCHKTFDSREECKKHENAHYDCKNYEVVDVGYDAMLVKHPTAICIQDKVTNKKLIYEYGYVQEENCEAAEQL